jgi:hypothetical protein
VLIGALFKKFGFFLNNPRIQGDHLKVLSKKKSALFCLQIGLETPLIYHVFYQSLRGPIEEIDVI